MHDLQYHNYTCMRLDFHTSGFPSACSKTEQGQHSFQAHYCISTERRALRRSFCQSSLQSRFTSCWTSTCEQPPLNDSRQSLRCCILCRRVREEHCSLSTFGIGILYRVYAGMCMYSHVHVHMYVIMCSYLSSSRR